MGKFSGNNLKNYTRSVDCRGYLDDPYCPDCDSLLPDESLDAKCCPYCGCLLDWKTYHILND